VDLAARKGIRFFLYIRTLARTEVNEVLAERWSLIDNLDRLAIAYSKSCPERLVAVDDRPKALIESRQIELASQAYAEIQIVYGCSFRELFDKPNAQLVR